MRRAIEHFRVVCSLDLPRDVALVAVGQAAKAVLPCDWTRSAIVAARSGVRTAYVESAELDAVAPPDWWRRVAGEPRGEARGGEPRGGSWSTLDATVATGAGEIAGIDLVRTTRRRPFDGADSALLLRLMPWIGHALRPRPSIEAAGPGEPAPPGPAPSWIEGAAVIGSDLAPRYVTGAFGQLCRQIEDAGAEGERPAAGPQALPAAVRAVLRRLRAGIDARDEARPPPFEVVATAHGPVSIDATLMRAAEDLADAAEAAPEAPALVRLVLRKHPAAAAAEALREAGCSPAQVAVGVRLALGRSKPAIAAELSIGPASVEDAARKLYQRLDVHSAAELGARLWAGA